MNPQPSVATALVQLVREHAVLARTPVGESFATITVGDHLENWPLRSSVFRAWLYRLYFAQEKRVPSDQAVEEALRTLEGYAAEGEVHELFVRVAQDYDGGPVYLDLCSDAWEVVEIDAAGWRVVTSSETPLHFRRPAGMLPLPAPKRGGSLDLLRPLVNIGSEDDFTLFKAWLIGAMRPRGPYPVLGIIGQQGSAKTSFSRIARELIDPNKAPVRAQPRDERDMMIAARNGWVIGFDNLSGLAPWLSDALCRLATGASFATRQLYTNAEESLFEAARPLILNGIDEVSTRGDLQDRSITLTLPVIPEQRRRTEADVWEAFKDAHPLILGALLDAVSAAVRNERMVRLERLPRMADFARWVEAAGPALDAPPGAFLEAYAANRASGNVAVLEGSLLAPLVLRIADGGTWRGSATELLTALEGEADEGARKRRDWPRSPRALSDALRRLAPHMLAEGVSISFSRNGSRRTISVVPTGDGSDDGDEGTQGIVTAQPLERSGGSDASDAVTMPSLKMGGREKEDGEGAGVAISSGAIVTCVTPSQRQENQVHAAVTMVPRSSSPTPIPPSPAWEARI